MVPLTDGQLLLIAPSIVVSDRIMHFDVCLTLQTPYLVVPVQSPMRMHGEPEIQIPSRKSIPALPTDLRPIDVEEIRHRYHQRAYSSHNRQCPMHS